MRSAFIQFMLDPEVIKSKDPYKTVAAKYFGVPEDRVTEEQRQEIKNILLWYRYNE